MTEPPPAAQQAPVAAGGRDAALTSWRRALEMTAPIARHPSVTFPVVIARLAEQFGDAPALLSEHAAMSFRELAARVEHYAGWALGQRLSDGGVVGLMMANCPEYLAIWLGISSVGGVAALLNTNLAGTALRHALDVVAPRHIVAGSDFAGAVAAVLPELDAAAQPWAHGGDVPAWPRIDVGRESLGGADYRRPTLADRALYIYTSGTTGLPKAASVSHGRVMQWTHWFAGLVGAGPGDRMYNCLPMYHSVGGVVATGAALVGGGSVMLRERFSASRFWDDVVRGDCTLFQYIGELCRYLVAAPPSASETKHRLRLACGNGLRGDVWEAFQARFRIPRIIEFYAATESSFSLYNCEGKPGAIGRLPPYLAHRFPVALIKVDAATGEPLRDASGSCVRCTADEIGEAIGKLADTGGGAGGFEGYTDAAASERKVLRGVFAPGDAWYRTGDLMRKDRAGYFHFVDRIGDTYRWKGENVSTTEVEAVLSACPGVHEIAVYGVEVPHAEGRAGMAALVVDAGFELAALAALAAERLPDYARPVFVRLAERIAQTGTFKPLKPALARDGFDPAAVDDAIYAYDRTERMFVTVDAALYRRICGGDWRL